ETFYGIGVNVAANIFLRGMVHSLMAGELLSDSQVNVALVSPKMRGFIDSGFQDRPNPVGSNGRHMARPDSAAALHQRDNGLLRRRLTIRAVASLAAHKCFVAFYHLLDSAKRRCII